jgi:hypothetical protein
MVPARLALCLSNDCGLDHRFLPFNFLFAFHFVAGCLSTSAGSPRAVNELRAPDCTGSTRTAWLHLGADGSSAQYRYRFGKRPNRDHLPV